MVTGIIPLSLGKGGLLATPPEGVRVGSTLTIENVGDEPARPAEITDDNGIPSVGDEPARPTDFTDDDDIPTDTDTINGVPTDTEDTDDGKSPTPTPERKPSKQPTVTLEHVIKYIESDKEKITQNKSLSEVNFQNIYKYNSFWITNPQLPVNAYTKKFTNLGEISPYYSINQYTPYPNYHDGTPAFFTTSSYPHEISLTRIYAGLGELDKDFAHVTFRKNEFLTLENLNFRGDFRAVNDYPHRNVTSPYSFYEKTSDGFFELKYKLYDFDISASYLDANYDHPSTDYLLPISNTTALKPISDKQTLYTFDIAWKYAYIGMLQSESKIPTYTFSTRSYLFGTKYQDTYNDINLAYQKNTDKVRRDAIYGVREKSDDGIISLKYSLNYPFTQENYTKPKYELSTDIVTYDDFSKINSVTALSANAYKNIFVIAEGSYSDKQRPDIIYLFENYLVKAYKIGIGYATIEADAINGIPTNNIFSIDANLLIGKKEVQQNIIFPSSVGTPYMVSENETFSTLSSQVNTNLLFFTHYLLNLNNTFTYDDLHKDFYQLPSFTNTADLSITRLMKNNNKIALGSTLYSIASVRKQDEKENTYIIPANFCFDLYLSIGITKAFDIKVLVNNLGRRGYYGNDYLDDFHFTTMMTWYLLN